MPRHRTGGGRKATPRSPRPVARAGIGRRAPETVAEGIFAGTKTGYGFVTAEGATRDIFIPREKTGGALDGDRVLCRYHTYTSGGIERTEGEVTRVTEAVRKTVVGTLCEELYGHGKHRSVRYFVEPDDTKLTILCYLDDVGDARLGDKVEALLPPRRPGSNFLVGEYLRSFGAAASREANYAAILSECAIPTEFSREELEEAERVAKMPLTAEGRVDRRDEVIFTIDGAGAKDLDDAVSLRRKKNGNYLLGVHIADVSTYVRPRGALDACSLSRGTSVYFTDKVVPMLPEALSNGACSLNAGEDKYALSCLMELTPDGSLAHTSIERSIIRSCVRGVYSEVNDLFEKKSKSKFYAKYKPVYKMLCDMYPLYQLLAANSTARGVLELESAEAKIILDDAGMPVDVVKRERGDAEKMIEQFMLTANEAVARFMCAKRVPCVFRVHEAPSEEKLTTYKNFVHNLGLSILPLKAEKLTTGAFAPVLAEAEEKGFGSVLSRITLRTQMKAKYSAVRGDHFGLGLEYYCHFTSPIRRYPDLSVHRILKYTLANGAPAAAKHYAAFAAESAERSSENELRALSAERDIEDLYKVIYMQKAVGETFDAVISSVTSFGLFCELENTCEGLIPIERLGEGYSFSEDALTLSRGKHAYKLGQPLRVRVTEANVLRRRVYMELAEEESGKKKR